MHTQSTPTPATTSQLSFWELDDIARGFISTALQDARACGASPSASEFFTPEAEGERSEGRADGTIPGCADESDIPADELARVVAFLAPLRERMAAEIAEALERPGYGSAIDLGGDLYLTIVGSGVGFWDRAELGYTGEELEAYEEATEAMAGAASGAHWQRAKAARDALPPTLGDRLSALCGRGEVNLYADGDAESYAVRFDCLYTLGAAS